MGALLEHIKSEMLTSFGFSSSLGYTENIRTNVISKNIGQTIYTKNDAFRNAALMKNPMKYRYEGYDTVPSTEGGMIGQAADATISEKPIKTDFLDKELGLYGYSMTNNLMFKNVKYNSIQPTGALLNDTDTYDSYVTSNFPLPSLWNRDSDTRSVIYSIDASIDSTSIFGSKMEEVIKWARNANTLKNISRSNTAYYIDSYGREKSAIINFNLGHETLLYLEGIENPYLDKNARDNLYYSDNIDYMYQESDEVENRSLLHITNRLFREGKINSLINRFSSGENGFATDGGLTNSSYSTHGHSRGRNLLNGSTTSINGYNNPYCRVWTSHYQYSKLSDMIRPFDKDTKSLMDRMPGYRPNNGAKRLMEHGVMLDSGVPRIAPSSNADGSDITENVKRCMFSIENLAWKNSGDIFNKLSPSQKGENGGRIMWFPPYGLTFNDQSNANWEKYDFIGRGEPIYAYKNSHRSGSISFILLVDHPSMIDAYAHSQNLLNAGLSKVSDAEYDLLRYFAGCYDLTDKIGSTCAKTEDEHYVTEVNVTLTPKPDPIPEEYKFTTFYCFANSYSGKDESKRSDTVTNQNNCNYEMSPLGDRTGQAMKCSTENLCDSDARQSRINMETKYSGNETELKRYVYDTRSFGLNTDQICGAIDKYIEDGKTASGVTVSGFTFEKTTLDKAISYFKQDESTLLIPFNKLITDGTISSRKGLITYLRKLNNVDENEYILDGPDDFTISVEAAGYASSHGYAEQNAKLAKRRAETLIKSLQEKGILNDNDTINYGDCYEIEVTNETDTKDRSSLTAKIDRCASVTFSLKSKNGMVKAVNELGEVEVINRKVEAKYGYKYNELSATTRYNAEESDLYYPEAQNEYLYFKNLEKNDKLTYNEIANKIRYFNPAFHSITPEGFNARLTFLQQCLRQGPTSSISDNFEGSEHDTKYGAGNLSFGRAPYCILRIGDFYNTKICIENINIQYDNDGGVRWDLNQEGIGVQPMFAKVTMQVHFIGGSDLEGPIDKLQNAISSNYYANTSVYDKLADIASSTTGNKS